MEILAFYDIAPQQIKIQIRSASQNDGLDVSFLKDSYTIAEKWRESGANREFMSCKFDASTSSDGITFFEILVDVNSIFPLNR